MPLSNARAKAALDAIISGAVRLRIYTAGYSTELVAFTISFGAATTASPSVATVGSTPISDTWDNTGTAAAYRVTNAAGDEIYWENTGTDAVNTSAAQVVLSNLSAVSGQPVNLNSFTMTMPTTMANEV